MDKKHPKQKHKKKHPTRNKPRNDAAGFAASSKSRPRLRLPKLPPRAPPPDWKTIGAAAIGAVGGAVASALIVNQKILSDETISLAMTATGGLGAFLTDGNTRVAFAGLGSAGAGQLALATMAKAALRAQAKAANDNQPAPQPAQLPASTAPVAPPRKSATGGGYVYDMFRDASRTYDDSDEDAWRYGTRDDDTGEAYVAVDLDDAA